MTFGLARNWWSLVIRGLLGIAVGIITFFWPGITLAALVFLFGGYALVDGIMSIVGAVRAIEKHERWGVLLFEGIMGIAAAAITVLWPGITALGLVYLVAAWAIVGGSLRIAAAMRLREHIRGEWLLLLSGIAAIIFGILIAAVPIVGALVLAIWVGAFALVYGVILMVLGFRLRSAERELHAGPSVTAPAH